MSREIGDQLATARFMTSLGAVEVVRGELAAAAKLHAGALEIARRIGSKPTVAQALRHRATLERYRGDLAAARASLEEALPIAGEVGDAVEVANTEIELAWVALDEGRPAAAAELAQRAASTLEDLGVIEEVWAREALAVAELALGQPAKARTSLERARTRIGDRGFRYAELSLALRSAEIGGDVEASRRDLLEVLAECRRLSRVALAYETELVGPVEPCRRRRRRPRGSRGAGGSRRGGGLRRHRRRASARCRGPSVRGETR